MAVILLPNQKKVSIQLFAACFQIGAVKCKMGNWLVIYFELTFTPLQHKIDKNVGKPLIVNCGLSSKTT